MSARKQIINYQRNSYMKAYANVFMNLDIIQTQNISLEHNLWQSFGNLKQKIYQLLLKNFNLIT